MHVAFGRVRRKSRIFADSTDGRGFLGVGFTVGICQKARMGERPPSISPYFLLREQQKNRGLYVFENRFGCMLFNNFNIFKSFNCFKGAMRPRYIYVWRFKHVGLRDETCRFTG